MATDVEALLLTIEANTKKLERDMAKANSIFAKQAADLKRKSDALNKDLGIKGAVLGGFDALGNKLKALIGIVGGLGAATQAFGIIREFADIADASKKVGVSAEDLQAYHFAAKLAGVGAEEMTSALVKFSKTAGGAEEESSQLAKLFEANGVSMKDAHGNLLPLNDLLQRFADIVARAKNDQEAAAMAAIGFGKAGAGMVPLLRQMTGGMDDLGQKAREAGVVLQNDLIERADDLDDMWTVAMMRMKAATAEFLLDLKDGTGLFGLWYQGIKSIVDLANDMKLPGIPVIAEAGRFPGDLRALGKTDRGDLSGATPIMPLSAGEQAAKDQLAWKLRMGKTEPDLSPWYGMNQPRSVNPVKTGAGSSAESLDELEREIRAITEKGEALAVEISMVGKSTEEREKALEMQKLKTAADRAEIELTPEKLAHLDAIASAYAQQVAQLEKVKKGHEDAQRAAEHLGEAAVDAMSDIILDGKNAGEVIQGLIKSLAKAALQAALMGSGPLGGLFGGGLLKGLFGGGSGGAGGAPMNITPFATGGVVTKPTLSLSGEAGPEAFVPLQGGRIPVSLRLPAARDLMPRAGGTTQVVFSPVIDARGAEAGAVARIERGLKDLANSIPRQVANVQRMRDVRGVVPS